MSVKVNQNHPALSWLFLVGGLLSIVVLMNFAAGYGLQEARADSFSLVGEGNTFDRVNALDVFVADRYAYVVTRENPGNDPEFYIFNIVDPASPSLVGSLNIGVAADVVYVEGQRAYLGTRKSKEEVMVIDVSDKTSPVKVASHDIAGTQDAISMKVIGTMVYVGTKAHGGGPEFFMIDMYDLNHIEVAATYEVGAHVNGIDVAGDDVFLATQHQFTEFIVLDVSDRSNLGVKASYGLAGLTTANAVLYSNQRLYGVADESGSAHNFFVWDYDPATSTTPVLTLLGSVHLGEDGTDLAVYGDRIYVTSNSPHTSLTALQLTGGTTPSIVGTYSAGEDVNGIAARNSLLYLATDHNNSELQIVDMGIDFEPKFLDENSDGLITVSCLGDSNTQSGNGGIISWCDRVDTALVGAPPGSTSTWNIVNNGVNNAVTYVDPDREDAFEQMSSTLATDAPDHIIMMFGANDVVSYVYNSSTSVPAALVETSISATRELIDWAKSSGVKNVMINLHAPIRGFRSHTELVGHLLNRLRQEFPSETIIDVFNSIDPEVDMSDVVHLNNDGQTKAALRVLEKLGF